MSKQNLYLTFIVLILFGVGCSSHPPVLPQVPVKGETNTGFSFSVEKSQIYLKTKAIYFV